MDAIRTVESWPQAVVDVTLILAIWVVPQVLGYLRNRQPSAKIEATRNESADTTNLTGHENTNGIKAILRRIRDALSRRIG